MPDAKTTAFPGDGKSEPHEDQAVGAGPNGKPSLGSGRRLKTFLRFAAFAVVFLVTNAVTGWAVLAIWYAVPAPEAVRVVLALVFVFLWLGGLVLCWRQRRIVRPFAPFAIAFAALLVWWSTIEPSNDREWQDDVARLPSADIDGDVITLRNIRNFKYRSASDYDPQWQEKVVDLKKLNTLDLIAVYWMGDAIAHTILSFGFDGEQVAISIEIRKEKGEAFSPLAGFFRRYELTYIAGDEQDLIGLRAKYRQPTEDVYLYRVRTETSKIRNLFLQYMKKINRLHDQPEFYNTGTTNCTTNIVTHIEAIQPHVPLSWKMLLSGYFPELIYERGALDRSLPFDQLRRRSLINGHAKSSDGSVPFSRLIRQGLPGMEN